MLLSIFLQCSSSSKTSTMVNITSKVFYQYSVKVMNPKRRTSFYVHNMTTTQKFLSKEETMDVLCKELGSKVEMVGFLSPGHGLKGKHNVLNSDSDLAQMYEEYRLKRCVIRLWCLCETKDNAVAVDTKKCGRESEEGEPLSSAKRSTCQQRMPAIEDIIDKLHEKHEEFSIEKLNAWGHMIHMGKHASYDNPSDLPYFKKCSKKSGSAAQDNPPDLPYFKKCSKKSGSAAQPIVDQVVSSLSPAKRVQLRSECIDQLSKLHSLLEKGGMPTEQYNALQKAIFY